MRLLVVKGFADTSMTDLTKAAGMNQRRLYKAFGTKDEIVSAAIRFCAESEACLAHEPLRTSHSGKEAISCMLEENVRLCGRWPRVRGCLFALNAFIIPTQDGSLQEFLSDRRRSLEKRVHDRVTQSVIEGELPEDTKVDAVANLCLAVLGGLTFRVIDGTPKGLLFRSIELFVNGLGFSPQKSRVRRTLKRGASRLNDTRGTFPDPQGGYRAHEGSCYPRIRRTRRTEI
jgi:AcrR family transcriptional regulator